MSEVDQYINRFPPEVQEILQKIRTLILENVPLAEERLAYGLPGYIYWANHWFTTALFRNILDFTARLMVMCILEKNCQRINRERALCSFP